MEKAAAVLELEERDKREAAKHFIPNGKSEEFIKMVGSGKSFVNIFIGANATSKTATGVNILANIIYGPQNDFFEYEMYQRWPYLKRGRIISDPTTIKEKIIPELKKWFPYNDAKKIPDAFYETAKEGKNFEGKFKTNNGWEIDIMSNEQDVKEFESVDLGFLWFDEPAPQDKFVASIARGRMGMTVVWTLTPLTYSAWIKDWLDTRESKEEADYIEAEMEDNCFAEETEILTQDGWRDLSRMRVGENIATYNLENGIIEYQKVNEIIKKRYIGEIIDVGMGLQATPNHRMIVFNSDKGVNRTIEKMPLEIISADKLRKGLRMLNFAESEHCVSILKDRYYYIDKKPERKSYDGIVSCVSVNNGTIIVRDKIEKYPLITGNCKIHGIRGILEHEHIQRIANAIPEDELEARVFGKFGHLIGRVHKSFRRKVHVIRPFPLNPRDFATYKAIDPHPRVADHVLYISVDRQGTNFVTGELLGEGKIKELHSRMIAFEAAMKYRIEGRLIDPSAYFDDQHRKENSVGEQLLALGEHYIKGSKDLMGGIKRTNDALDYQEVNGDMLRPPEIYFFDTVPIMIKQLDEYVWQEWKGASKDNKKKNPNPRDINDHQPENLHRLLLSEPIFVQPQAQQMRSKPTGGSGQPMSEEGRFDYHDSDLDPFA